MKTRSRVDSFGTFLDYTISGDTYHAQQVGAIGLSAHAHDMMFDQIWSQAAGKIDLTSLSSQLGHLLAALKQEATETEQYQALGAVACAQEAAKEGNGPKALENLNKAGVWALGVAEKMGVSVAAAAIKASLGARV